MEFFVCVKPAFNSWGYEQYPQDCELVIKSLLKNAKEIVRKYDSNEIIVVKRIEHLLYYSYFRVLNDESWLGIVFRDQKIFQDAFSLLAFFQNCIKYFAYKKCIIEREKNNYKLRKDKIYGDGTTRGVIDALPITLQSNLKDMLLNSDRITDYKTTQSGHPVGGRLNSHKESETFPEYLRKGFDLVYILPTESNEKIPQKNNMGITIVWIICALFNLITPFFIQLSYSTTICNLTILGSVFFFVALIKQLKKIYGIIGWVSLAIIVSASVTAIYGIYNVISEDKVNVISNIPQDFVFIPSSTLKNYHKYNGVDTTVNVNDFYIGRYEVTQNDYYIVVENTSIDDERGKCPIHGITIRDVVNFCNKKSEKEGYDGFYEISNDDVTAKSNGNGYRLPTEYEWVLAARESGEMASLYAAGDDLDSISWNRGNSRDELHAVGTTAKAGNRNLYDMNGNVSELCIRNNGQIWAKGGSYKDKLPLLFKETEGVFQGVNLSSQNMLRNTVGVRLVFIPKQ